MERRNFLKSIFYTSVVSGAGLVLPSTGAFAFTTGTPIPRTLVNLMLLGGADLRFLFIPHPDDPLPGTGYINKFWEKRSSLYPAGYENYSDLFNGNSATGVDALYLETTYSVGLKTFRFGIHKSAAWLRQQFLDGNVAIVSNAYGSTNRRHDHSQLISYAGDRDTEQFIYDRSGWGGRFSAAIGAETNVVPVSHDVSPFCNSISTSDRLDQVVHVRDSRNFALPEEDIINRTENDRRNVLARSLKAFYETGPDEIAKNPDNWAFRRFFQHERTLRSFGSSLKGRLDQFDRPGALQSLIDGVTKLSNKSFATQCANLYDCMQASDILHLRSAFMEINGWDTHKNQASDLQENFQDVFGAGGGLDVLTSLLASDGSGANDNMVFTLQSDFGRQLAANGSQGTDHGEGTYTLVLGPGVTGGLYGDMFPAAEVKADSEGKIPFDTQGAHITGKTPFEHLIAEVCEWAEPGSSLAETSATGMGVFTKVKMDTLPAPEVPLSPLFKPSIVLAGVMTSPTGYSGKLDDINVTIDDRYSNNISLKTTPDAQGLYQSPLLPQNTTYIVTPSKPDFSFDPPHRKVKVQDKDSIKANFQVTPLLNIKSILMMFPDASIPGNVRVIALGSNFVNQQTSLKVGSLDAVVYDQYSNENYLWFSIPTTATGALTVDTPFSPMYTHDVLFEDLQIGV